MDSIVDISNNPKLILEKFQELFREKRVLVKKGKIFKRKLIRYYILRNEYLIYYARQHSNKLKGTVNLIRSISIPIKSPWIKYRFCIKVSTSDFHSEFYIFPLTIYEQSLFMLYFKLASNGEIQQALEKSKFTSIDQEIQLLAEITVAKVNKSHSNSISHSSHHEETMEINKNEQVKHDCSYDANIENDSESEEVKAEILPTIVYLPTKEIPPTKEGIRMQGIRCLWNFELDSAVLHFEKIKDQDLRSVLLCAEVNLFKVLVTGRKSDVLKSSDLLQEMEKYFSHTTEDYSDIILAETSLLKSVLLLVSGHKLKAFITLRSA